VPVTLGDAAAHNVNAHFHMTANLRFVLTRGYAGRGDCRASATVTRAGFRAGTAYRVNATPRMSARISFGFGALMRPTICCGS